MCFLFASIGILSFHLNSRVRQIGGVSFRQRIPDVARAKKAILQKTGGAGAAFEHWRICGASEDYYCVCPDLLCSEESFYNRFNSLLLVKTKKYTCDIAFAV